ncbi:MAG: OsmC family protein, partial [Candidatus Kapaibacterium sp.]
KDHYKTALVYGRHSFFSDEMPDSGGTDAGPGPSGFLATSLASCTAITLRMYADRKGYDVEKIDVVVELTRKDERGITHSLFEQTISVTGNIGESEKKRLLEIADKCLIHKALKGEITITSTIR